VIVGVSRTVVGLRTLRLAVAEARRRGAPLFAVRAWTFTYPQFTWPGIVTLASDRAGRPDDTARKTITAAFSDCLGGIPADIDVRPEPTYGKPGQALVEYAYRDTDIIFVGHRPRRWLGRFPFPSVARYCIAHATCPVQVIPPDMFARAASGTSGARALRRDLSELTHR
jgi:nucleotide-binding universal stress UspA family protein